MFRSDRLGCLIFRVRHRLGLKRRNSLRAMMRGYMVLKRSGSLPLIQDLHNALRETLPLTGLQYYSPTIFGASYSEAELVVRQTIATQEHLISKALLQSLGRNSSAVVLPLPISWLRVIKSCGFKVAHFESAVFLFFKGLKHLATGVVQIVINLVRQFKFQSNRASNEQSFVYFCDLVESNLPQPSGDSNSYCIVNWYRQWQGRDKEAKNIAHGVVGYSGQCVGDSRLFYRCSPLPVIVGAISLIRYVLWAIRAISISALDLMRGRWWHAMLLREASFAALVRYGDQSAIARQYFFHNSLYYPPLWTYELPRTGSKAVFYWYSTNSEPFQRPNGSRPFTTPYSLMNWSHYLVWDEVQANFVKRCEGKDPNIEVVGPIWFQDIGKPLPNFSGRTICVFDVQPVRDSFYYALAPTVDFYNPKTSINFFKDIIDVLLDKNFRILIKRKRNIGRLLHPSYKELLKTLTSLPEVYEFDPATSAFSIIKKSDAVISFPFTSTALIASSLGKPSVYYDPTGSQVTNRITARGLEILCSPAELRSWIEDLDL